MERGLQRIAQRDIPICRPPANDKTELVEELIKESVQLIRICFELRRRVTYTSIEIVAMHLDDAMSGVDKWKHPLDLVWRTQNGRLNVCVFKRLLYQAIEVRC